MSEEHSSDKTQPRYDVFLSHNSADKPAVEEIARHLREDKIEPFLDKWHLVPGKEWQVGLTDAIERSECMAVFFGPSATGPWHHREMQVALNKAARTRDDYRVIPVLLPGSELSQVHGFLELRAWVDFRPGLDDDVAYRRLVAGIRGAAPDSETFELADQPRPYRGIERFEGDQHQFFFGRDEEIRRLIGRLQQDHFVAVVGASGSGKSSLVRAGLVTKAAQDSVRGIEDWRRITCLPKNDLMLQLATNLVAHLPEAQRPALVKGFLDDFNSDSNGLITALTTLFPNPDSPVLLLIDQFEELFTQRSTGPEHQAPWRERTASMAANLLTAVEAHLEWLHVIVTLRADFVDKFVSGDFPDFRSLLEQRQFWLGTMSQEDLRDVILRPATQRGAYFEKGLVERILQEMSGQAAALPLLEEALDTLWNNRIGPWLTHQAYDASGGVGGALADKADGIFRNLNESDQAIARRVFLELVQLGEGSRDTRRRAPVASLASAADDPAHVRSVIERFSTASARLITFSSQETAGDDEQADETAEVTHEALIGHWSQLTQWLDESRDDLRFQRRLNEAALRWRAEAAKLDGRPEGLLWRPPDLDLARDFAERVGETMTDLQLEFYRRSQRAEEDRIAAIEEAKRKEAEQLRREKRIMRVAATVVSIAAVLVVVLFVVAFQSYRGAHDAETRAGASLEQAHTEKIRLLVAQSHARREETPPLAVLLSAEALKMAEKHKILTSLANQSLREALNNCGGVLLDSRHEGAVNSVAIGTDGRWMATASDDTTARLWNLTGDRPAAKPFVLRDHSEPLNSLAFSQDGKWLVTAAEDATPRLWDLTASDPSTTALTLKGHEQPIRAVAISTDSHWLVTAGDDATVRRWDLTADDPSTTAVALKGHKAPIRHAAVSPDNRLLVTGSLDNTARVWELSADEPGVVAVFEHPDHVWTVTFSPQGDAVATGCEDNHARIWPASDQSAIPRVLRGHKEPVNSLAFSPDGRWLVTGSDDRTARRWDATVFDPSETVTVLEGHGARISSLSISPDSRWLATASDDGTVRRWEVDSGSPATYDHVLRAHEGPINSIAYSPDGTWLATASNDRTVRRWNFSRDDALANPNTLIGHTDIVLASAISPDGRWLVTASRDKTARRWELAAHEPSKSAVELKGHTDMLLAVAISPDGRWVVTASKDNTARRWDLAADDPSSRSLELKGHKHLVSSLAISPDSQWLVTGSTDKTARRWKLADDDPSATAVSFERHTDAVSSVAISPDGRRFATASEDQSVLLWEADDPANPVALTGHQGQVFSVAFSPDGRWLATASSDQSGRLWDLNADPPASGLILKGHRGDVNSVEFSSDGHWLVTASDDQTARLWDLTRKDPSTDPTVLKGHGPMFATAVSADSRWLATACGNQSLLWELTSIDRSQAIALTGHRGDVFCVAIAPDDRWLATGSTDMTARRWSLSPNQLLHDAERAAGRKLSPEEWENYFPGETYINNQ